MMQTPNNGQSIAGVSRETRFFFLLNNCPGHPSVEELCTDAGEIPAMFLPSNTTALIQPMDQNVIQNLKMGYRKLLLTNILIDPVHNENLEKTLKM
ncbi:hypothetical protein AVEN_155511-1 [Araneus ventricosus]|uniref:DDE-1 domain-containing protein n=1 Tax=Araneus ventricosus TaxID=182803 RepID=A0A4Y1ZR57_ARAVE|nr:hypothetical protein AVEN_155511-1 [Araneus ventricosus]